MTSQHVQQDLKNDLEFSRALHGNNVSAKKGFSAMLSKSSNAQQATVKSYFSFWGQKPGQETEEEKKALSSNYYKDFYEFGWCKSFHFSRYYPGEPFHQAMARHEHYIASKMNIQDNYNVLDVGCGVGGPACEISTFTDANITGLNINDYQIERARNYIARRGLSEKIKFVKGDFMQMPFDDASFDAAYAFEATCHASKLEGVYGEIYRVLKPGGICGMNEWVMTDVYDASDPEQQKLKHYIEIGSGVTKLSTLSDARNAFKKVGFEILLEDDLAAHGDIIPWYYPIAGQLKHVANWSDFFMMLAISNFGRTIVNYIIGGLEMIGLAPAGTQQYHKILTRNAVALVASGEKGIFTPMMLFVCKKPEA
ncbi:Sterol 24-C-methyltransferase erg-4 [Neolecta irregularis DAH-3]|uniref:Sterol 24-C-methyltransferase n=1 Tax=Neolecta irregularis (strain DAH-3) TaxID=1198029 RepID=A0A1U7LVJ6_NEOID|nr:Sterol 24-C-methyltransferase erg-4 [Neolecta irregularis DAH-3]|eukprot:OLL26572.1 Sterol 24-C-methyltransferase erg-4 [Neolecta irregularis DAH-3]